MRKKPGTKQQRGDGTTMNLHGQPRAGKETRSYMPLGSKFLNTGPSRDIKRKLSPQRAFNGLQVADAIQRLVKESPKALNEANEAGPSAMYVEKGHPKPRKKMNSLKPKPIVRSRSADIDVKPNSSKSIVSVKAKKGVARNKAALSNRSSTDEGASAAGASLPLNA